MEDNQKQNLFVRNMRNSLSVIEQHIQKNDQINITFVCKIINILLDQIFCWHSEQPHYPKNEYELNSMSNIPNTEFMEIVAYNIDNPILQILFYLSDKYNTVIVFSNKCVIDQSVVTGSIKDFDDCQNLKLNDVTKCYEISFKEYWSNLKSLINELIK